MIPRDMGGTNRVAALARGSGNGVVEVEFGDEGGGEVGSILRFSVSRMCGWLVLFSIEEGCYVSSEQCYCVCYYP